MYSRSISTCSRKNNTLSPAENIPTKNTMKSQASTIVPSTGRSASISALSLCAVLAVLLSPPARAAAIWDGNGNADNSGTWETAANWDDNAVPITTANAQLLNVTAGTRTVTIGAAQTIQNLTLTQTTVGAINQLDINENLTLSKGGHPSSNPFAITATAGAGSVVINVAAGKTLLATTPNFGMAPSLAGTLNLATGAVFRMQYGPDVQAIVNLSSSGVIMADGGVIDFDWTAAGNGSGARNFTNTGTLTMKNSSALSWSSSTGRPTSGFGIGVGNNNSGTFNVESGSTVGFESLYNTGTMNVGSSTSGVSDAQVALGSPLNTFGTVILTNGATSAGSALAAVININGNALLGRTTGVSGGQTTLNNGAGNSTGSTINVGDGTVATTLTVSGGANFNTTGAKVENFAGNTIAIKSNATMKLSGVATGSTNDSAAVFINNGTLIQTGTLVMQGNWSGARSVTTGAAGIYQISGTSANMTLMPSSFAGGNTGNIAPTFSVAGKMSGATSNDKFTYTNSSGNAGWNTLAATVTGQITPGNGSAGSGTSSVGALELANINLTLQTGSQLTFDIGGAQAGGIFDKLNLSGTGAIMALGTGASTLNIQMVNGYAGSGGQTYQIITGTSLTGTFSSLLFNGAALGGIPEYRVEYLSNGVEVILAVPEPSTYAMLLAGLGTLLVVRHRRARRSIR